jgi:hypothetical protein
VTREPSTEIAEARADPSDRSGGADGAIERTAIEMRPRRGARDPRTRRAAAVSVRRRSDQWPAVDRERARTCSRATTRAARRHRRRSSVNRRQILSARDRRRRCGEARPARGRRRASARRSKVDEMTNWRDGTGDTGVRRPRRPLQLHRVAVPRRGRVIGRPLPPKLQGSPAPRGDGNGPCSFPASASAGVRQRSRGTDPRWSPWPDHRPAPYERQRDVRNRPW